MKIKVPPFLIFHSLLLFSVCSLNSNAQSTAEDNKAIAEKFEHYYNNGRHDSIYNMFSLDLQSSIPRLNVTTFLINLRNDVGRIVTLDFEKFDAGCAYYKTKFENALFSINLCNDTSGRISTYYVRPYSPDTFPYIERNITSLKLPFNGKWSVLWGGDTREMNHHLNVPAQKNAFDVVVRDKIGKTYKTNGTTNEDYYAFGQEIVAPAAGEVVLAVDGIKDNIPGEQNTYFSPGNTVIIKTANNEHLVLCHFKQHTIKVTEGQKIKQGEVLGLCGNSGNSTEPHIHFHIQNIEYINNATGVKCYFSKILLNGNVRTDYSPVKGDNLENIQ